MKNHSLFLAFLIVLLFLSFAFVPQIEATEIFSDGFESGNFNAWDGTGGSPTVQDSIKHCGTYAALFDANYEYCYEDMTLQTPTFHRAYVRFSGTPTSGEYTSFFRGRNGYGEYQQPDRLGIYNDGGTLKWYMRSYYNFGWQTDLWTSPDINVDQWYCIEIKVLENGWSSELRVYIDGTEELTKTSIFMDMNGGMNRIANGLWTDMSSPPNVYTDCVVIADTYIGIEEEGQEEYFYGSINVQFGIYSERSFSFSLHSSINPVFMVESRIDFIIGQVLNLFGSLNQVFSIDSEKSMSFSLMKTINPLFTLNSLTDFIIPGLLNLVGTINLIFGIDGSTDLALPIQYATEEFVLYIMFGGAILLMIVIFLLYLARR